MKLQDATARVTGANREIGHAFVQALLNADVQKVYAVIRDRNSLEGLRIVDPARVIPLQVDITDYTSVSQLSKQAPDANFLSIMLKFYRLAVF